MAKRRLRGRQVSVDRRKAQRLDMPMRIQYKLMSRKKTLQETFCRDLSGGGVRLTLDHSLKKGSKLITHLYFPEESSPVTAITSVVWCKKIMRENKKPVFDTGMKYIKIIPKDRERFVCLFCETMLNYFFKFNEKKQSRVSQRATIRR